MSRLFITGGSGMLGSYIASKAVDMGWETWATYGTHPVEIKGCQILQVDITDERALAEAIDAVQPDSIIHTAALVKPDVCEKLQYESIRANVLAVNYLVCLSRRIGCHFAHVSTDLVFGGKETPYLPDDKISPPNFYGITKAAAEESVKTFENSAIIRTSIIYGPRKFFFLESFSDKVIESLRDGRAFKAFTDQRRCPIPAWNLADVILEIAVRKKTGVFHAVCPESSTRHEFALKLAELFGLDGNLLEEVSMDDVRSAAFRPKTLILDTSSTQSKLDTTLLGFEEGILELKSRMENFE